eukprot:s1828_g10.t1
MISWRLLSVCILAERYATTPITCDDDADTSGAVSDASLLQMNLKLNSLPPSCRIWQHTYILNASCDHFGLGHAAGFLVSGASRSGARFLTDLFQSLGSLERTPRLGMVEMASHSSAHWLDQYEDTPCEDPFTKSLTCDVLFFLTDELTV